jgi:hypothetical protein
MALSNGGMMGIDVAIFFSSGGGVGATVEAVRDQPASVREEEEGGRLGRAGGLGRPGGRGPVGEGRENRLVKKRDWVDRPDGLKVTRENFFRIKFDFFEYTKALEICTRRFRRNFDMRIFLNSPRLLKDFRKI